MKLSQRQAVGELVIRLIQDSDLVHVRIETDGNGWEYWSMVWSAEAAEMIGALVDEQLEN